MHEHVARRPSTAGQRATSRPEPLFLQRMAGNRATASLLQGLVAQRTCGPQCECTKCSPETQVQRLPLTIQRATAGQFVTDVKPDPQTVAVGGSNAADWNSNAQMKVGGGGEAGKVSVAQVANLETHLKDDGTVDGATVGWTVTKTVPTVVESGFSNAGELAAAKSLADRVAQHESSHESIELGGRTDFAKTLKGKKDSEGDGLINALECKIGKKERQLDNTEGEITLTSSNQIALSGKDHPEYEDSCKGP